jgi:peroxiredoxin (alkyl hydroperoxide reductase subunit C)
MAFARRADDFAALNTELLGLSIDSHYAHIAWIRSIKESFGVDVKFPIIADLDMKVARAYGMVQPGASDTQAVRATFVIDPEGMLRAMVYYPMSNGRSVDEFLRLVKALQTSTEHGVATPENWQPGEDVIVPTPQTVDAAEARLAEGFDTKDWYYSTRAL